MSLQNFELHLFQRRDARWQVRVEGLPQGRVYTDAWALPLSALRAAGALVEAATESTPLAPPA